MNDATTTSDRPSVPTTFEEYVRVHNITDGHPNLDEWRMVWQRDLQVEASAPTVIPPCPSWCTLPAGHDYDSTDGWEDTLTFERRHVAFQGQAACDVSATEHNRSGVVTVDRPSVYVHAESDEYSADAVRATAAELLQAADMLELIAQPASPTVLDDRGQAAALDGYSPLNP